MKIKNISNLWKGRIKRTNFFIVNIIVATVYFVINYLLDDQPQTLLTTLQIIETTILCLLLLVAAFYMIVLSVRRAKDIGIGSNGIEFIVGFYIIQVLLGVISVASLLLDFTSYIWIYLISLPLLFIEMFINLRLLLAVSEKKDNIYGVYEEHTKKSFINDILNR